VFIFRIIGSSNRTEKWVVGGAFFFLTMVLKVPFLLGLFQFETISFMEAAVCIALGFTSIVWFEVYKVINSGNK
jgi:P-type Ca2+ transporter type 2C